MAESFFEKDRSEQIYDVAKLDANVATGYRVFQSLRLLSTAALCAGIFLYAGIRYHIGPLVVFGIFLVLFSVLIVGLTYWNRKRTMDALAGKLSAPAPAVPIAPSADETVVDHVAGAMATGGHAVTFVVGSAGAMAAPENTIIVTNKNIWFVYVPLPGADITGETNVSQADFLLAPDDFEKKYQELYTQGGLQSLINTSTKNFSIPFSELKEVSTSLFKGVVFTTTAGKSYSYSIHDLKAKQRLLVLLKDYVKA